jgi:hypothetical protein
MAATDNVSPSRTDEQVGSAVKTTKSLLHRISERADLLHCLGKAMGRIEGRIELVDELEQFLDTQTRTAAVENINLKREILQFLAEKQRDAKLQMESILSRI